MALAGTPVTDLSGNAVAIGHLGTFSVQIASPTQLVVTDQPTSPVTAGATFVVSVSLENAQDQVQTGYSGTVTIALPSSSGGATLGGTLTVNVSQGVANFSDLTLDKAGTGYTLQVTSSGLPGVTAGPFGVSPAAASQLIVTTQPTSPVTTGESFSLAVSVEDRFKNPVTNYSGTLTAAISVNPGGGTLGGTLTATVSQGVATFSDLTIDQPGTGYTIQVTAPGLTTATSDPFTVTTGAGGQIAHPTQLVVTTQPTSPVTAGATFVVSVSLENAQDQVQTGYSGTVTIALTFQLRRCHARGHAHRQRQPGRGHLLRSHPGQGRLRIHAPGHIQRAAGSEHDLHRREPRGGQPVDRDDPAHQPRHHR